MLKSAFARAIIEAGTATLSDARRHLEDPRVVDCIRVKRFGAIPGELGDSIEPVGTARANHRAAAGHLLRVYRVRNRAALLAIAGEGLHE